MKQRLIILVVVLAAIAGGLMWLQDYLSYRTVSFILTAPATGADIYQRPDNSESSVKIQTITSNQKLRLKDGVYSYIPQGADADTAPNSFSVTKDETVTISPAYSLAYRQKLAPQIEPALQKALQAKYPTVMPQYKINNITIMAKADWAGVLLVPATMDENDPGALYRAILKKNGSSWEVTGKPQVVLTVYNTPGVERSLLQAANKLSLR